MLIYLYEIEVSLFIVNFIVNFSYVALGFSLIKSFVKIWLGYIWRNNTITLLVVRLD